MHNLFHASAMPALAFLLVGRDPCLERICESRSALPLVNVYTKRVRDSLYQSGIAPNLGPESSPKDWNQA